MKRWSFDTQRINDKKIKDCKHHNNTQVFCVINASFFQVLDQIDGIHPG